MNFLHGEIGGDGSPAFQGKGGVSVPLNGAAGAGSGTPVVLGARPEHLKLSDDGVPVEIVVVEPTGSEIQIIGRTPGGEEIVANFRERHAFEPGQTVKLTVEPNLIHLFNGETGKRL
jgi:multiple sugar transport system ATP-binding protein